MNKKKSQLRLTLEAMKIGMIHSDHVDITNYWRAQSIANSVRRATGQHFETRWDRPTKTMTIKRVA